MRRRSDKAALRCRFCGKELFPRERSHAELQEEYELLLLAAWEVVEAFHGEAPAQMEALLDKYPILRRPE
jgi:hypothetical protein